jgi:hypothetical protein
MMNTPASKPDAFDKLLDTYVEELKAMSDEQALDGGDPVSMEREGQAMLQRSREAAGQRRLAAAREKLQQQKTSPTGRSAAPAVTAQEARRFLEQAANDRRFTIAARELKELSDDEVLRRYAQLKKLEIEPSGDET